MAAGEVSTILSEWLLVALIVFTLFIEVALHKLEHWVKHKHNHLVGVVRVLYRELMILGIISFIFIVYELSFQPDGNTILSFEFAHLFIFLFAIFYTIVVLVTMYMSSRMSFKWKQMERMDVVHYLSLKDKYSQMKTTVNRRDDKLWRYFWWFPNLKQLINYSHMHEVMSFHDIRFQFIYYRNLPEDFRFSSFLRKIKTTTFLDLVESHWSLYVIFLVIVLFDILRRTIFQNDTSSNPVSSKTFILRHFATIKQKTIHHVIRAGKEDDEDLYEKYKDYIHSSVEYGNNTDAIIIICLSVVLAIVVQILAHKIKKIYWTITKHPRTYYEGVQAETVEEELMKAAEQRAELRDRRRSRSISLSKKHQTSMDGNDTGNEGDVDDEHKKYEMKQRKLEQQYQQQISTEEETNFEDEITDMDPGNELLDPMSAPPLQSPLVKNTSSTSLAQMDDTTSNHNLEDDMNHATQDSISKYSVRHSMERARTELVGGSHSNHAQRSLTDLQPSKLASHREDGNMHHDSHGHGHDHGHGHGHDHDEGIGFFNDHGEHHGPVDESLVRHSLDVPRRNKTNGAASSSHHHGSELSTTAASTTSAILARAALEAAKKRTASEIPSPSATYQQDNDSSSSLKLPGKMASPKLRSPKSSRRGSIDDDSFKGGSYGGSVRGSIDLPGRKGYKRTIPGSNAPSRRSIELAVVMARDELKAQLEKPTAYDYDNDTDTEKDKKKNRNILSRRSLSPGDKRSGISHHRRSIENNNNTASENESSTQKESRIRFSVDTSRHRNSTTRDSSNGDVHIDMSTLDDVEDKNGITSKDIITKEEITNMNNPTIMKYFEEHRDVENIAPTGYPRFIVKLIPRLGRVASRVEKLFWFGSHKFYMWCVEFVLFFSTVLLAAATAGLSLIAIENKKFPYKALSINALHIISLISTVLNLIFVLFRIAVIMKRYIFILHNASLIPEIVALEAIQNVRGKRVARDDYSSDISGSETEREDEATRERRKNLGRFFRSEAQSGNIEGIEASKDNDGQSSNNGINYLIRQSLDSGRKRNKRRMANQRRKVRLWNHTNAELSGTETNNNDDEIGTRDDDELTVSTLNEMERKSRDRRSITDSTSNNNNNNNNNNRNEIEVE